MNTDGFWGDRHRDTRRVRGDTDSSSSAKDPHAFIYKPADEDHPYLSDHGAQHSPDQPYHHLCLSVFLCDRSPIDT